MLFEDISCYLKILYVITRPCLNGFGTWHLKIKHVIWKLKHAISNKKTKLEMPWLKILNYKNLQMPPFIVCHMSIFKENMMLFQDIFKNMMLFEDFLCYFQKSSNAMFLWWHMKWLYVIWRLLKKTGVIYSLFDL